MSTRDTSPPRLLESIRIMDGAADLLPYHQQRMDRARRVHFPKSSVIRLKKVLEGIELPATGLYKLRLEYTTEILDTEVIPYEIRPCARIRIVQADGVRYGKKFADRSDIRKCLEKKGNCDDILMIQRGHVTDTSYANVALYDGRHWYTPAWPLLRGTRREYLLENGVVRPSVIRERDLPNFQRIRLMNAMLPWDEAPTLDMEAVVR